MIKLIIRWGHFNSDAGLYDQLTNTCLNVDRWLIIVLTDELYLRLIGARVLRVCIKEQ